MKPSALICFNDRLALGAYQALADAGLGFPPTCRSCRSTTTSSPHGSNLN
jgi:hypothetical protein